MKPEQVNTALPFELPAQLLSFADRGGSWPSWLASLRRLVADIMTEWELEWDGPPMSGSCALVVPVRMATGRGAVVKLAWPHDEEEHEHLALKALQGNGAVEMFRADPRRHVMLLERLDAQRDLTSVPELEACRIVGDLYARIHIPSLPQLRTLPSYIERWTDDLQLLPRSMPLPRRLVDHAVALGRDFVADPDSVGTTVHGDLHFENVLAGEREPWLVIDPKPVSGDPHYEVAPLLINRWDEIKTSGNVRRAIRQRFHRVVDTAGFDEDRVRDWVIVRMVHNALWTIQGSSVPSPARRDRLDRDDLAWITQCLTVAKAIQD